MAELTIRPEEIRDALDNFVQNYEPETAVREEVGTVVTSGDGIAHVEGLPSAMANELLRFENGTMGIALNLEERQIGVVVLGDSDGIDEGSTVRGTGEVLSVPVGRDISVASWTRWVTQLMVSARSKVLRDVVPSRSRLPALWTVRKFVSRCRLVLKPSTR